MRRTPGSSTLVTMGPTAGKSADEIEGFEQFDVQETASRRAILCPPVGGFLDLPDCNRRDDDAHC